METSEYLYNQILAQWDDGMRKGEFPRPGVDSHWISGAVRLTAFRSVDEWLVVFEELTYYIGMGDFSVLVYAFGNRLEKCGIQNPHHVYPRSIADAIIEKTKSYGVKVLPKYHSEEDWCPNPFDFEVMIVGAPKQFGKTPNDYIQAGIDLDEPISGDDCLDDIIRVLRLLCETLPARQRFYPENFLLEYVRRPVDLPPSLQLEDWCHPGIGDVSKPSQSPCLDSLAKAIAFNDPNLYECSKELINTHWSNWPDWLA